MENRVATGAAAPIPYKDNSFGRKLVSKNARGILTRKVAATPFAMVNVVQPHPFKNPFMQK